MQVLDVLRKITIERKKDHYVIYYDNELIAEIVPLSPNARKYVDKVIAFIELFK